jgi:benzylsuccinate CoA-transferase BbsE subunit
LLSLCGDPDRAPLRPTVEQASAQGALQAVVGTLVALRARGRGGGGQRVDVSMQEAITNTLGNSQAFYAMEGVVNKRAGGGRASGPTGTRLIFPCADGHVAYLRSPATVPLLHQWMLDEGFEPGFDPDLWSRRNVVGRDAPSREQVRALEARFEAFFATRPKMELYEEGQERGTQLCPVATVPDILANRQLAHRDFFREVEHPEWGRSFTYPGAPFKMSASPWQAGPAAPSHGQHQDEFLPAAKAKPGDEAS